MKEKLSGKLGLNDRQAKSFPLEFWDDNHFFTLHFSFHPVTDSGSSSRRGDLMEHNNGELTPAGSVLHKHEKVYSY